LIKRLEFKLDHKQIGHGGFVHKGLSGVFDSSKVEGAGSPEAPRTAALRHRSGNTRDDKENSPSPNPVHQQRSSGVPPARASGGALGMSAISSGNPLATFKSPEPPARAADTTIVEQTTIIKTHEDLTVSQKAVARVRTGLTDLKGKLAVMKEKKE